MCGAPCNGDHVAHKIKKNIWAPTEKIYYFDCKGMTVVGLAERKRMKEDEE